MESRVLQDWTTVRGTGTTAVIQSRNDWLDAAEYADATFWLDVRNVTNPGAGTVSLSYETAPIADNDLFVAMTTIAGVVVATPVTSKVFLNTSPILPLGRFLRWKLVGTQAGTWDITFRIYVTFGVGSPPAFTPLALPGLLLWLRADLGVTLVSGNVSVWADQSGLGNDVQGTIGSRPAFVSSSIGGRPSVNFAGSTFLQNTVINLISSLGDTAYSVLAVAQNGSGALFTVRLTNTYSSALFYQTNTYVHGDGVNASANVTVANTTGETQSSTSPFKSCHRFKGGAVNPDIFLNTTSRAITSAGTNQATENGTTGFQIGNTHASQFWGGLISEIIVTGNAIADSDRQKIEGYQSYFFGF